jgi:hypothetical protein
MKRNREMLAAEEKTTSIRKERLPDQSSNQKILD